MSCEMPTPRTLPQPPFGLCLRLGFEDRAARKGEPVPALPSRDLYFNLLIELNRLCAPSEPHLSDLVIVGLNFRVGSLVRKVCPAARNCSYNFATAYDLEFGLTFFCCQLIVTRHNVSASDCRGFNCFTWN